MLLEAGLVLSFYFGFRIFENNNKLSTLKKPKNELIRDKETQKKLKYNLKISTANLGLAAMRQFISPQLAPLFLSSFFYNNLKLYQHTEQSLKNRKFDIHVSSAVASLIAIAANQYFATAIGCFFYHFSEKTIAQTKKQSKQLLTNVFEQLPRMVWIYESSVEIEIPLEKVKINDIVIVTTGEMIPIDGIITDGIAIIDQHTLTGESQPDEKEVGDQVFASTLVISGKIWIKVEKTGSNSTIAKINQILIHSADFKSQAQLWGEKLADQMALPFFMFSILTLGLFGPTVGLIVFTANFGNNIRILGPLSTLNHIKLASQQGILIKDGRSLEALKKVDTILFDKTGTLTESVPEVGKIILCDDEYSRDELLIYAAAAECKLKHPIAQAILNKAKALSLTLPDIDNSKYQIGYGIMVHINQKVIRVGSARFMKLEGIALPKHFEKIMANAHGHTHVMVAVNQKLIGVIEVRTAVRPEVEKIISELRQRGIKHLAIVSGDHQQPTQELAKKLGLDDYFYDVLPQDKAKIVEQLQKQGQSVAFVGDGINDTIAMKKASVSISLTGASAIATDVAEIIFMNGTLSNLPFLFDISKDLENNLQTSLGITLLPMAISLNGAFVFNMGYTTAVIIKKLILLMGIGNAMLPLRKLEKSKNFFSKTN
jgi:Cu2+-exporting ATPase